MSVSRDAYLDLIKENKQLQERFDAAREREANAMAAVAEAYRAQIAASASALECQTKLLDQERVIAALAKKCAQLEADREYNAGLVRAMEGRMIADLKAEPADRAAIRALDHMLTQMLNETGCCGREQAINAQKYHAPTIARAYGSVDNLASEE
jgi:hypothetical protein